LSEIRTEFVAFAESLANNDCSFDSWKKYAQTHYIEDNLEKARIEIVRICSDDDSIGNELWPLTDAAIAEIRQVVSQLNSSNDEGPLGVGSGSSLRQNEWLLRSKTVNELQTYCSP